MAGAVTYEEQRSFLYNRLDEQVAASAYPVSAALGVSFDGKHPLFPGATALHASNPLPGAGAGGSSAARRHFSNPNQPSGTYGELISSAGKLLKKTEFHYGEATLAAPKLPASYPVNTFGTVHPQLFTVNAVSSGIRYRVEATKVSDGRILISAVPLGDVDQTLHRLIVVELLVALGVILALIALGWLVIKVGLRPLERIGRTTTEITHGGDLSRRVTPATARTEVGRLGIQLNEMLDQIEQAFGAQQASEDRLRQFLADASHELRTPLASVKGYVELIDIGAVEDPAEFSRVIGRLQAETTRMGGLIEDLLLLARLDELPEVERQPVELRGLAEHAVQDARAVAPDRAITLSVPDVELITLGAGNQLRQVLANLLSNAIIHTPAGSPIELTLSQRGEQIELSVRDHGSGLPAGVNDHVFDRFWRQASGRSRANGGTGLGLAIVKALVEAHHGSVRAYNAADDNGAVFVVTLPAAPEPLAPGEPPRAVIPEPAPGAQGTPSLL